MLDIYEIVVLTFLLTDKTNQIKFFEKSLLMAYISPETVFEMPFLILSNTNVDF